MTPSLGFGIDIGGSGVKGAPVDLTTGALTAERLRLPTPSPSKPQPVAETVAELVAAFDLPADLPLGLTFPAPIKHNVVGFIANLHKSWKGVDVDELFTEAIGRDVVAVNDADAAGVAEAAFGAARGVPGVVIVTTLGTGIGSALLVDGTLVPNTELGHLEIDGHDAERRASSGVREAEDLSWREWADRLQRFYETVEMLFSPDLLVVGGGVSRKHEKFLPLLRTKAPIVPAELRNSAGIVGAAYLAAQTDG
ncbi:ROK family protein [Georgenia sp. TF02-10]|uniref:polyphosphate--glucose phosphotransferase n=1 Tax=Georgenia sp. TF02-10 TaxID=2917725 RepID=UPI001FA81588|nr:ROK family protein [Georgenia sp. TF02-10]UNX53458.1 ROK family protein [Georgenia sp. TF02-10]